MIQLLILHARKVKIVLEDEDVSVLTFECNEVQVD